MSFPNLPDKYQSEPLLTAEDIVAYRKRLGRMPGFRSPHGVLFCLENGLPRRMRWRIPVRDAGRMNADVHAVRRARNTVIVLTNFGGASPMVVELAEELAVMGAKKMILMGTAGILASDISAGDIVVCDRALRDDGASHHYLPPEKYIDADAGLAGRLAGAIRARGASCVMGTTWTTDAPYRETRQEVQQYQSEGVKVVEIGSAGLFTIGRVRGIPTAAAVVGMDNLATLHWQTPARLGGIFRALEVVYAAAIDVLAES